MAQKVLVKEYRTTAQYQWDAPILATRGWEVVDVTQAVGRTGCRRVLAMGIFALILRPKPRLVVTYRRDY